MANNKFSSPSEYFLSISYKNFAKNVNFGHRFGAFAFSADENTFKVNYACSKSFLFRYTLTVASWILFTLYCTFEFVQRTIRRDKSYYYSLSFVLQTTMLLGVILHSFMWYESKYMCAILNDYVHTYLEFQKNRCGRKTLISKTKSIVVSVILKLSNCIVLCFPAIVTLFYITQYQAPIFLYEKLPIPELRKSIIFNFIYVFTTGGWCLYLFWSTWSAAIVVLQAALIGVILHGSLSKEIKLGKVKSEYKSEDEVRQPKLLIKYHRILMLLCQCMIDRIKIYLAPLSYLINRTVLLCTFIVIKFSKTSSTYNSVLLCAAMMVHTLWWLVAIKLMYLNATGINKITSSLKNFSSRNVHDRLYVKKYLQSCRLIAFTVGNYKKISKISGPKFLLGVTRGTMKALVGSKIYNLN